MLYLKDAMRAFILHSESPEGTALPTVVELMRPARFEPESSAPWTCCVRCNASPRTWRSLLMSTAAPRGLITLEDLIEELVGDISDEYDRERPDYTLNDDGTFRLSLPVWVLMSWARFSAVNSTMKMLIRWAVCSLSIWVWCQLLVLRLRLTVFIFVRLFVGPPPPGGYAAGVV